MAAVNVPTLASETVLHIGSFGVRNTILMAWVTAVVLIIVALFGKGTGYKLVPGRFQSILEMLVEGLFDFFESIMQNRKLTLLFFPLIATFFLYILISNWLGILPGVGSVTVPIALGAQERIPLLRSMNADVNTTLFLSTVSVLITQIAGIIALGPISYAGKFLVPPWKKPYGIGTFVGLLELISEVAKIISFTFRLFGNIFAGEVLLVVMTYLIPYLIPVPFYGLEVFVGVIQAFVFAVLSLIFIKLAMTGHEEHEAQAHA